MKKFLSVALAGAMAMSMASVAFAAVTPVAADDVDYFTADSKAWSYKEEDHTFNTASDVHFGDEVYYEVKAGEKGASIDKIVDPDVIKNIKIKKAEWETGKDYIDDVKLVKKLSDDGKAYYYVEVSLKEVPTETEDKDIIGTITLSSTKYKADGEKEKKIDVALTVNNEGVVVGSSDKTTDGEKVYKFSDVDGDEEYEIELYGDAGKFVVDTRGQGDLVIKSDVEYNKGIENAASDVNYVYFNGNGATFNKIGTLYLNADEGDFLYRVNADGTLTKLDANYDEDEEAFAVRTRVLGSYVIAEEELDLTKVNATVAPEEVAPVAPVSPANPSTGARI